MTKCPDTQENQDTAGASPTVLADGQTLPTGKKPRDLAERTTRFAEAIVRFANTVPRTPVTSPLISQLVRAGTSSGANYAEADEAVSRKDFAHLISTCKKESRETKYWLRVIVAAVPDLASPARPLWQEAHELHMIFAKIYHNTRSKPQ